MGVEIITDRPLHRPLAAGDAASVDALCGPVAVARWPERITHPCPEAERMPQCIADTARFYAAWAARA